MSSSDFIPILPMASVAVAAIVALLGIAVHRSHRATFLITLAGEAAAFAALPYSMTAVPSQVTSLISADRYSLFITGLLLAGSFAVAFLAYGYLNRHSEEKEEFYILLLIATLGSMILSASSHFISFFLGLEILSVSLYVMIAYMSAEKLRLEAGLKYLILAGSSAAFLAFGMALVYAETGSMEFSRIASSLNQPTLVLLSGFALILSGVGFKLALVPFHMWTPDVYQGSPAPVAAFVATVSKGAVFAVLLRYFIQANAYGNRSLFLILTGVSIASMVAGNLLALMQGNLKRILAYSSIAHLGYLLIAFLSSRDLAVPASSYYLSAYFLTILAAFGVVSALSTEKTEAETVEGYRGLFWRRPWLAMVLSASMFSLAGIPLTIGFMGKFYLLSAGVGAARWLLVVTLVCTSAVGLFYYLRIVATLYAPALDADQLPAVPWTSHLILAGLMVLILWFGIYPAFLMRLIRSAIL